MNSFNGEFRNVYYKYYNLKKKWIKNNANIWYNKTCKEKKLPQNLLVQKTNLIIPDQN